MSTEEQAKSETVQETKPEDEGTAPGSSETHLEVEKTQNAPDANNETVEKPAEGSNADENVAKSEQPPTLPESTENVPEQEAPVTNDQSLPAETNQDVQKITDDGEDHKPPGSDVETQNSNESEKQVEISAEKQEDAPIKSEQSEEHQPSVETVNNDLTDVPKEQPVEVKLDDVVEDAPKEQPVEVKSDDVAEDASKEQPVEVKSDDVAEESVNADNQKNDCPGDLEPEKVETEKQEVENVVEETELPDDDEDAKNPAYIPRKGAFYMHDSRKDDDESKVEENQRKSRADKKWSHDLFDDRQQRPKSKTELIRKYGFDIRHGEKDEPEDEGRKPRETAPRRGGTTVSSTRGRSKFQVGEWIPRKEPEERSKPVKSGAAPQNVRREPDNREPRERESRRQREPDDQEPRERENRRQREPDNREPRERENRRQWESEDREPRDRENKRQREPMRGSAGAHPRGTVKEAHPPLHRGQSSMFKRTVVPSANKRWEKTENGDRTTTERKYDNNHNTRGNRRPGTTGPTRTETNGRQNQGVFTRPAMSNGAPFKQSSTPTPPRTKRPPNQPTPPTGKFQSQGVRSPIVGAPMPLIPGPGGAFVPAPVVPIAMVPVVAPGTPPINYPHPRQPTDVVYFDPNSQTGAPRTPPQPRERRTLEIAPPSQ